MLLEITLPLDHFFLIQLHAKICEKINMIRDQNMLNALIITSVLALSYIFHVARCEPALYSALRVKVLKSYEVMQLY